MNLIDLSINLGRVRRPHNMKAIILQLKRFTSGTHSRQLLVFPNSSQGRTMQCSEKWQQFHDGTNRNTRLVKEAASL